MNLPTHYFSPEKKENSLGTLKMKYRAASRLVMSEVAKLEGTTLNFKQAVNHLLTEYQKQHPEIKVDMSQSLDYTIQELKMLSPPDFKSTNPQSIFEVTYNFYFRN